MFVVVAFAVLGGGVGMVLSLVCRAVLTRCCACTVSISCVLAVVMALIASLFSLFISPRTSAVPSVNSWNSAIFAAPNVTALQALSLSCFFCSSVSLICRFRYVWLAAVSRSQSSRPVSYLPVFFNAAIVSIKHWCSVRGGWHATHMCASFLTISQKKAKSLLGPVVLRVVPMHLQHPLGSVCRMSLLGT